MGSTVFTLVFLFFVLVKGQDKNVTMDTLLQAVLHLGGNMSQEIDDFKSQVNKKLLELENGLQNVTVKLQHVADFVQDEIEDSNNTIHELQQELMLDLEGVKDSLDKVKEMIVKNKTNKTEPINGSGTTELPTESTNGTEPSTDTTEPSTNGTEPSTDTTEPSTDTTEPSTDTTEPSTNPTEPSTNATKLSTNGTEPSTIKSPTASTEPNLGSTNTGDDGVSYNVHNLLIVIVVVLVLCSLVYIGYQYRETVCHSKIMLYGTVYYIFSVFPKGASSTTPHSF